MNKKQLIVLWVVGLYIAATGSLFLLDRHVEKHYREQIHLRGSLFSDVLAGRKRPPKPFLERLLLSGPIYWWPRRMLIVLPFVIIAGPIALYHFRTKGNAPR